VFKIEKTYKNKGIDILMTGKPGESNLLNAKHTFKTSPLI